MQKMVAIANHFQKEYNLNEDYKNYSFTLKLREENVIYLTTAELRAFRALPIHHVNPLSVKKQNEVKDLALLMTETGLRFQDAALTRGDIVNGMIEKTQKKTGHTVWVPFTERLRGICEEI